MNVLVGERMDSEGISNVSVMEECGKIVVLIETPEDTVVKIIMDPKDGMVLAKTLLSCASYAKHKYN